MSSDRLTTNSAVGLRLVDDFSGAAPLGPVQAWLDRADGAGGWIEEARRPTFNSLSVLSFPGLERRARPAAAAPVRYRVRIRADFYRLLQLVPVEFDAPPWDDSAPPVPLLDAPSDFVLVPGPGYPFPAHVRVLHGLVLRAGAPVADALVMLASAERVRTDERGSFSLPLRWAPFSGAITLDATPPSGAGASLSVTLPAALSTCQTFHL